MEPPMTVDPRTNIQLERGQWARLGLVTALVSIVAVLVVQALAIALWPEIALFAPLDNYARSAIFTLVPVLGATGLLAWLAGRSARPVGTFIGVSVVVLLLSIIPDFVLPVPHKTLLASSVTASLHVVAGALTMLMLVIGYRRQTSQK
jgi:hypothetical protein